MISASKTTKSILTKSGITLRRDRDEARLTFLKNLRKVLQKSLIEFYPHLRVTGFQKSPIVINNVAKARLSRKSCAGARSLLKRYSQWDSCKSSLYLLLLSLASLRA